MPDVDLTSGHFLGLNPAVGADGPLTTGRPAVVSEPAAHTRVGMHLARTLGLSQGLVNRSSLHALIDALVCRPDGAELLVDEAIYPVGVWAAQAAGGEGHSRTYRHHDAQDAERIAHRLRYPVVVLTDGLCGSCLRPAPLAALAEIAEDRGGYVVIDDSLAAGLGPGGLGCAGWLAPSPRGLVSVASLAKGYAAPLAVTAGPRTVIETIGADGPTRMHSSPASAADVFAVHQSLADSSLPDRRTRLAAHVARVRARCADLALSPLGVPFAVVSTEGGRRDPLDLQRRLSALGVHTLATRGRCTGRPTLSLCLRADLAERDLKHVEQALTRAVGGVAA